MVRVLFVCLGNICRSPMAEAIFRHLTAEAGLSDRMETDSAGTGDWHIGKPPHKGTLEILSRNAIHGDDLRARQTRPDDFEKFDYIVAMDESNVGNLRRLVGTHTGRAKLVKLLDYMPEAHVRDVPDPYYTGNFEEVYGLVRTSCERLLQAIREERGW